MALGVQRVLLAISTMRKFTIAFSVHRSARLVSCDLRLVLVKIYTVHGNTAHHLNNEHNEQARDGP